MYGLMYASVVEQLLRHPCSSVLQFILKTTVWHQIRNGRINKTYRMPQLQYSSLKWLDSTHH